MSGPALNDDDDILAAEIALGLLTGTEAAARLAGNPALRARVDWWQDRLAAMVADAPAPDRALWPRIVAALPAHAPVRRAGNDNAMGRLARQPAAAALAIGLVVAAVAALAWHPAAPPPVPLVAAQPTPVLLASLSGKQRASAAVAYRPADGQLRIIPAAIDADGKSAELWIIPADGRPRSLGVIDAGEPSSRNISAERRRWIAAGASFAISLEPRGGSPSGLPTGPVIAAGKIYAG